MTESKLSRLYSEEPISGFPGNILKEENFNEIVDSLLCLNMPASNNFSGIMDFGNGMSFEVSQKDKYGNAVQVCLTTRYKTNKTPFYPDDVGYRYKNKYIVNADENSDVSILRPDGTAISKQFITVTSMGQILIENYQYCNFIYVDNLTVIKKRYIDIKRNADTSISGYTVSYEN